MDRPETVAQQILGVESLNVLKLLWQMPFGRVITENMLDREPNLPRAEEDAALQVMDTVQLIVRVCLLGQDLPHIAEDCQFLAQAGIMKLRTYLMAAKSAWTGFSIAA